MDEAERLLQRIDYLTDALAVAEAEIEQVKGYVRDLFKDGDWIDYVKTPEQYRAVGSLAAWKRP